MSNMPVVMWTDGNGNDRYTDLIVIGMGLVSNVMV